MQINVDGVHHFFVVTLLPLLTRVGLKVLAAVAVWMVGRRVISWGMGFIERALRARKFDPTLGRYLYSSLVAFLTVCLVVGIAGFLGIETATFAALLAGVGLAIGTAWGDLLKSFAAGIFLLGLRPFRVGDEVTIAGVTGVVQEIGIFVCIVRTSDHVRVTISNHKIFSDNIRNFTEPAACRVDLRLQLPHNSDYKRAITLIEGALPDIAEIVKDPPPRVELLEITSAGPVLTLRPFCHESKATQVATACNKAMLDVLTPVGYFTANPPTVPKQA